jgi:hypothetical protein
MKTTVELPDDLVNEIRRLAVQKGKNFKDAFADLLRRGLEASAAAKGTVVKVDKAMLKRRKALTKKFVAAEWKRDVTGY